MSELDALVVGGGVSGLVLAHYLAETGLAVEVWERDGRVGGKIKTISKQGYRLDNAASMVMNFQRELDGFIDSAGLTASKRGRSSNNQRYILHAGRLQPAPASIGSLFNTPLLSTRAKLRLVAEPLITRGTDPHESVADFVTRRLGQEFVSKVFEPYLSGPLASDVERAEAWSTMPRLTALEQRYGSLALGALLRRLKRRGTAARPEVFSFAGGMQTLIESLADRRGFAVRTGMAVVELRRVKKGWNVRAENDGVTTSLNCRQLILCTPAYTAASLLKILDPEISRLLKTIDYAPVSVVHTGFERARINHPLDGSGFLLPANGGYLPNGCLWISSQFSDRAPTDRVLLTSYLGGARNPTAANCCENRCLHAVMPMLRELLGARGDPEMLHVARHRRALPLYHDDYSRRLAAIGERLEFLPGVHLGANYIGGVSVRDRILYANRLTARILHRHKQMSGTADLETAFELVPAMAAAR
ncbi:MAG: protoporphyrinogen oxidase [Gammaproteobacteria bacterium]